MRAAILNSNCRGQIGTEFQIARLAVTPYRMRFMGQQHRVTVKRRRHKAYVERKKAAAKAIPANRPAAPKPKAKKTTAGK